MRAVSRLILSAVILLITGLLAAVAMYLPQFFFPYYTNLSRQVLSAISNITGAFPFALWEVGLVAVACVAINTIVMTQFTFDGDYRKDRVGK